MKTHCLVCKILTCPFNRHKKRIDMFMKDGRLSYILKNRLDATCFQYDSAYPEYKDRANRRQSDSALKNKALKIATDPGVNGYQRGLAPMVYKFFNERAKGSGIRRKVYSSYKDNIWGVDLANMQLISKCNKGIRYLLCLFDLFSRYA